MSLMLRRVVTVAMLGACVGGVWLWISPLAAPLPADALVASVHDQHKIPPVLADGRYTVFSPAEVTTFLAALKKIVRIPDPLQRCLVYPDPPGSHWPRDVVTAYCHYQFQATLWFPEVRKLVESGQAKTLDRRFAEILKAQLSNPEARGLLDVTYANNFPDGRPLMRATLDAWKKQSPHSAFAWAASGTAYLQAAAVARGEDYASRTPPLRLDAMHRLLARANADLQRAYKIDPRVTPIYSAMIRIGGMLGHPSYALEAARQGMKVDPGNFAVQQQLMWAAQPAWGGSIERMQHVADAAQAHRAKNPLLSLLPARAQAYAASLSNCDCHPEPEAYRQVFDHVGDADALANAGYAASRTASSGAAVIYLAETLRFKPTNNQARIARTYALAALGEPDWAMVDADSLVHDEPTNAQTLSARGNVYEALHDYPHALEDLSAAFKLDPADRWPLIEMGNIYVDHTHEWDKGWAIAERLIRDHPENPQGWTIRACVQQRQPRAGLRDTAEYFIAHFGNDPTQQTHVAEMRRILARGPAS